MRPVEQGEGDSFVLAFRHATDAVACALALQREPLAPIRVRIGVHTGDVQLRDEGNYIGTTINKAARLRDLAHGGQIVLSGAATELAADCLPPNAWLIELGTHRLCDLPRAERVVQLCHPDISVEFPPLRVAEDAVTGRLPVQLTNFIGRRDEIVELRSLLADNRLLTLTGTGGVGKTRLALQLATMTAAEFAGGAWCVDLAPIPHPDVIGVTIALALGLPISRDVPRSTPWRGLSAIGPRCCWSTIVSTCWTGPPPSSPSYWHTAQISRYWRRVASRSGSAAK